MNKKKTKNKKKIKNLFLKILIAVTVVAVIGLGVYYFLTAEDEESSLTLLEKQWIENNKSTLIDIRVPNNIDVISKSGEGVLFNFLNYFEKTTELSLNKIPYNYPLTEEDLLSFMVLKNDQTIKDTDIFLFEENYILVGSEEGYLTDLSEISTSTIGVLSSDSNIITEAIFNTSVSFRSYNTISNLLEAVKNGNVSYACIPRYTYLEDIISEQVYVKYSLNNLSNKIVLRLGSNERLNNILTKSLSNWLNKYYQEDFEKMLMASYEEFINISELEKSTLTSRVYRYGYVKDTAYNVKRGSDFYGVAGEYLKALENMLNMEFSYLEYDTKEDLENALSSGNIDLAFINFPYEDENYLITSSSFTEKMVAISKNYISINDKNGLANYKLSLLKDNYLYDNFAQGYSVNDLNNYNSDVKDDNIIVLDEADYLYLKDSDLSNYKYLFTDTFTGNYSFAVNTKNEVLYNVLNYLLDNTDYTEYKVRGINNLLNVSANQNSFKEIYFIFLAIVLLPIIVIFLSVVIIRNSKKLKITRKESFLKYNDVLTNLKNRNYLNDNIDKWDDTKIYPRTVVVLDLNNLKYVNDNYGHAEGNELIKQAAAVLINTQLEKSEIVRTDGNEFLIYLIAYSKTQIETYISKLSKEFEKLPYGFGAAIGYSMIEDEIKTIDDAINEATINMRMDKVQNYK